MAHQRAAGTRRRGRSRGGDHSLLHGWRQADQHLCDCCRCLPGAKADRGRRAGGVWRRGLRTDPTPGHWAVSGCSRNGPRHRVLRVAFDFEGDRSGQLRGRQIGGRRARSAARPALARRARPDGRSVSQHGPLPEGDGHRRDGHRRWRPVHGHRTQVAGGRARLCFSADDPQPAIDGWRTGGADETAARILSALGSGERCDHCPRARDRRHPLLEPRG